MEDVTDEEDIIRLLLNEEPNNFDLLQSYYAADRAILIREDQRGKELVISSYIEAVVYRRREYPDLDDLIDLELKRRIGDDAVRWLGYDRIGYMRRAMNSNSKELIAARAR